MAADTYPRMKLSLIVTKHKINVKIYRESAVKVVLGNFNPSFYSFGEITLQPFFTCHKQMKKFKTGNNLILP